MVSYFSWLKRSFLRVSFGLVARKRRDRGISLLRSTSISMISLNHNSKSFVPVLEKVGASPTVTQPLVVSYRLFVVVNRPRRVSQDIGNTFMAPLSAHGPRCGINQSPGACGGGSGSGAGLSFLCAIPQDYRITRLRQAAKSNGRRTKHRTERREKSFPHVGPWSD
jgi:hypothetical protein